MFLDLSFLFSSCKVKIVGLQDKDHNKAINLPCMVDFVEPWTEMPFLRCDIKIIIKRST